MPKSRHPAGIRGLAKNAAPVKSAPAGVPSSKSLQNANLAELMAQTITQVKALVEAIPCNANRAAHHGFGDALAALAGARAERESGIATTHPGVAVSDHQNSLEFGLRELALLLLGASKSMLDPADAPPTPPKRAADPRSGVFDRGCRCYHRTFHPRYRAPPSPGTGNLPADGVRATEPFSRRQGRGNARITTSRKAP